MIKPFITLSLLLNTMILFMVLHSFYFPKKEHLQTLLAFGTLTKQSNICFSSAYDNQQFNPTYPEMSSLTKMDFIYE